MNTTSTRTSVPLALAQAVGHGSRGLAVISGLALVVLTVLVASDVFMRNVLGSAIEGVIEYVSQWLMPVTVLFALSLTELKGEHMRVSLIEDGMAGLPRRLTGLLGQLIVIAISGVLAWSSLSLALDSFALREAVPMGTGLLVVWPIKAAIVIAWLWLTVQSLARLVCMLIAGPAPLEESQGGTSDVVSSEGGPRA